MKTTTAILILTASMVCMASAGPPTPEINGPTERHPGALTFLDASDSAGAEKFNWIVDTSMVKVPSQPGPDVSQTVSQLRSMGFVVNEPEGDAEPLWAISDDNKRLWLSSYPGTYSVVLGVSNADGLVMLPWRVTVDDRVIVPVPVPVPVPTPTPIPIPTPADFSAQLASAVKAVPQAAAEFERIAIVYEATAEQVKIGLFTKPEQVIAWTAALTTTAAGGYAQEWTKIDTTVIQPHLATLNLKVGADYEKPWREIAAAIKAGLTDIPPPQPHPQPEPAPLPVVGLHVLIVEEMDDRIAGRLPRTQSDIFTSSTLVDWYQTNGVTWRSFDDDVDQSQLDEKWKAGLNRVKESGQPLPCVLISNETKGFIGPLPKTEDELKALIAKYR